MRRIKKIVKALLVRCLVAPENTVIRGGLVRGRLLPRSIAERNLSMVFGNYERQIQNLLREQSQIGRAHV